MNSLSKVLIVVALFFASYSFVQAEALDTLWTKSYDSSQYSIRRCIGEKMDIVVTSDGGCAAIGQRNEMACLLKMDSSGDTLWSKYCAETRSYGIDIVETFDGNLAVVGYANGEYIFLSKFNQQGETIWSVIINNYPYCTCREFIETYDGSFVIVGEARASQHYWSQLMLLKLDSSGNEIFSRMYGGYYQYEYCSGRSVVETYDNGYAIFANVKYEDTDFIEQVIKTDMMGNIECCYDIDNGRDWAQKIIQTDDEGFLLIESVNGFYYHSYLTKIDFWGNIEWEQDYICNGSSGMSFKDVRETFDNGFIIVGHSMGICDDLIVYKLDNQGNEEWHRMIEKEYNVYGYSIDLNDNGGAYIAGATNNPAQIGDELLIVRLPDGYLSVDEKSGEIPATYEILSVYPNPFNPSTTVSLVLPNPADLSVKVFNNNGRMVSVLADGQYGEGNHTFLFDGSNLSSGTYFIQAVAPGISSDVKRVMLVK